MSVVFVNQCIFQTISHTTPAHDGLKLRFQYHYDFGIIRKSISLKKSARARKCSTKFSFVCTSKSL